jgi:RNA polymerase sigma factor (sigma-70 family)
MDSEDVMQEALLRAYVGLGRLRVANSAQFIAWMAKIVERTILDFVRSEGRRKRGRDRRLLDGSTADVLVERVPTKGPTPTQVAMGKELAERYFTALESLEHRHREAILMRRHAGMSFSEIAEFLDVGSEAQARMLLSRALAKLARLMDVEDPVKRSSSRSASKQDSRGDRW